MSESYGGPGSTNPMGGSTPESGSSTNGPLGERGRQVAERIKPAADDLMARGRDLVEKGNQRRFILEHENRVMVNLPLTVAAVIGLVVMVVAPWAAILGLLAALFTRVTIRIEEEGLR